MIYPNAHTEVEDLGKSKAGGREYHATIRLRPIAYYVDGSPRPITNRLAATGDAAFGLGADELIAVRVASRLQGNAPLWEVKDTRRRAWARLALEGGGVVQGKALDDNAWLFPEALPGADLSVTYGGHRVAADFALRKGHPKAITWRLDAAEGFDPKAMTLGDLALREPVLLPPQETPWEPPVPLTWEVGSRGGRYTLTCALPDGDWAGWTLDPTLVVLAKDDGEDAIFFSNNVTKYGGSGFVGLYQESANSSKIGRTLIRFDLSALPDAVFSEATLSMCSYYAGGATVNANVHRVKKSWVEMEVVWAEYATGLPWTSPGGFGEDDCEQASIASAPVGASFALTWVNWSLPLTKAGMDLGYGWLIKYATETGTKLANFYSSEGWGSGDVPYRPKLTVTWVEGGGPMLASGIFRSGAFGNKMVR